MKQGFPNIIGAVDATHIRIRMLPNVNAADFIDRDRQRSVVLQACCDSRRVFTNVYGIWPGSVHDARILRHSALWDIGEGGEISPAGLQCCVLADAGYPLRPWMITPISGRVRGVQDNATAAHYNFKLSSTRMVVERTFGLIKGVWRRLFMMVEMQSTDRIRNIILACVVMSNWYQLTRLGVLQSYLDGRPDFGTFDRRALPYIHRDLASRVQDMPRMRGEVDTAKRTRAVFVRFVS